jgi:hypothetical protein
VTGEGGIGGCGDANYHSNVGKINRLPGSPENCDYGKMDFIGFSITANQGASNWITVG